MSANVVPTNGFTTPAEEDNLQDGLSCNELFAHSEGLTYK